MHEPPLVAAYAFLAARRYDLAAAAFRDALQSDPDNAAALANLSLCLLWQQQPQDARRVALRALEVDPDDAYACLAHGLALAELGLEREARQALERAIELDPQEPGYYGQLAIWCSASGDWPRALALADQGLALDPTESLCIAARARALLGQGHAEAAVDLLRGQLEADPESLHMLCAMGWLELMRGNHQASAMHFREVLSLDPEDQSAHIGLPEALRARFWPYQMLLRSAIWLYHCPLKVRIPRVLASLVALHFLPTFPTAATIASLRAMAFLWAMRDAEARSLMDDSAMQEGRLSVLGMIGTLVFGGLYWWTDDVSALIAMLTSMTLAIVLPLIFVLCLPHQRPWVIRYCGLIAVVGFGSAAAFLPFNPPWLHRLGLALELLLGILLALSPFIPYLIEKLLIRRK